jgi:hypothetical protein
MTLGETTLGKLALYHIIAIWYIIWPFGNLVVCWCMSAVLVYCITKNLALLMPAIVLRLTGGRAVHTAEKKCDLVSVARMRTNAFIWPLVLRP